MLKTSSYSHLRIWAPVACIIFMGSNLTKAEDWPQEFQNYIAQSMEQDHIAGAAVALVKGNDIILATGMGLRDISANLPVDAETLFHIGSTQKSMTAMMIARLVDKGLMGWDTPIISYAPSFSLANSQATHQVTMRHLLSMRAGISWDAEADLPDNPTPRDVLDLIGKTPLIARPGEAFSYSNLSSSAAGYLGVLVSGGNVEGLYEGYAQLLQKTILDPIGMDTATIKRSDALNNPNYSFSYRLNSRGYPVLSPSYDFDGDALAPSGSLKANVNDMAKYIATQMNGGIAPNGNRIVSRQQSQEPFKPYLENYGMGWEIDDYRGTKIISHNGAYDDYASIIGFLPRYDVGFVILLNSEAAGKNLIEDAPFELVDILRERL